MKPSALATAALAVALSQEIMAPDRLWIGCLLGWTLLALALIDLSEGVLPDRLTVPLLTVGLIWGATLGQFATHLGGALTGLAMLGVPAWAYRRIRGRDGMGWGDVKLAGAAGAWLGWPTMPAMILIAALLAIAVIAVRRRTVSLTTRLPFGPALAASTWLLWLSHLDGAIVATGVISP